MRLNVRKLSMVLVCALFATNVAAQEVEDPAETARFHWGPIRFTPTLEITNFGRDSNVYNEAADPKSDFTAAIGPAVEVWMRPFRSRLAVRTGGQYLYFKQYADQRAWNTNNEVRWEVPLARLTPFVEGSYMNSRQRQGFEIDARSRRRDTSYTVGTRLRVSGKTELVGSFRRFDVEYDERETFLGAELAKALNRREEASKVQLRYALTPLTTFVLDSEVGRDRFEVASLRDTDSLKIMPGFELKPAALISGTVFVGFRRFDAKTSSVPDYSGVVAAVKARYIRAATRFDLVVDRDLAYSFEQTQPYYALLNTGLTVTQRVTMRWDLIGRGSVQRLAYRSLQTLPVPPPERIDDGHEYGGGLSFRLSEGVRLGVIVSRVNRDSNFVGFRSFEATRVFGSITYGRQQ
jgi:hypothetical protein